MACLEFAMSGASVFGDGSYRKERTSPVYLGVAVHVECFRTNRKRNSTKDINGLLENMHTWTRAMPTASELCEYLPLANLYVSSGSNLCCSMVEVAEGLAVLHGSQDGAIFPSGGPVSILPRSAAGTVLKVFRDFVI